MTWQPRTLKLAFRGTVESRGDAGPFLRAPGDYVLVVRGYLRLLLMACPDGCGETVVVNVDSKAGKAWRYYATRRGVSLFPSVWRDTGCRSHYIVWNDRILLFGGDEEELGHAEVDPALVARVAAALIGRGEVGFWELADELEEVPWAVLDALDALVASGRASRGSARGSFRLKLRT